MNDANTFVFLGPSLCIEDAREILPNATYMPPIQCGDIVRVLRLEPKALVIIDGVFERVAAVWHKEILLALHRGVTVVGGGSMGALRAAEMSPLGMLGVGRSFEEFSDGTLTDDDEVAIVHTSEGEALCDAMVNIRDTATGAQREGLLTADEARAIIEDAKGLFYAERTFEGSAEATLPSERSEAVVAWSRAGGFCDRKREDARRVLAFVSQLDAAPPRPTANNAPFVTGFLRTLCRQAACSTQRRMRADLPHDEQVACAARFLGPVYEDLRRLAQLMAALDDVARTRGLHAASELPAWAPEPHASWCDAEASDYRARMGRIDTLLSEDDTIASRTHLLHLLRIGAMYPRFSGETADDTVAAFASATPATHRLLSVVAKMWTGFDRLCAQEQLVPRVTDLQEYTDRFRYVRDLGSGTAMSTWLRHNELSIAEFSTMMIAWYRLEHMVSTANLNVFEVRPHADSAWWLRDALWVSGMYARAEKLLRSPRAQSMHPPEDDETAFARDFCDGLASVAIEQRAMRDAVMVAV